MATGIHGGSADSPKNRVKGGAKKVLSSIIIDNCHVVFKELSYKLKIDQKINLLIGCQARAPGEFF